MQQRGEYRIGAGCDAVWLALRDPEVLARCIDGCQAITRAGDDAFAVTVRKSVGSLAGVFTAEVKLADLDPPHVYALEVTVKRGGTGSGTGSARISLTEDGSATLLRYDIEGHVGGKLAQVDQRLIDAEARRMADNFFARFRELVAPDAAVADTGATEAAGRSPTLAPILLAVAGVAGTFALLRMRMRRSRTGTPPAV